MSRPQLSEVAKPRQWRSNDLPLYMRRLTVWVMEIFVWGSEDATSRHFLGDDSPPFYWAVSRVLFHVLVSFSFFFLLICRLVFRVIGKIVSQVTFLCKQETFSFRKLLEFFNIVLSKIFPGYS